MAELTTLEGTVFCFQADAVAAVASTDADTGAAVTTIYGLSAGTLRIGEGVEEFLQRIGPTQFAKLTRPDGSDVWINGLAATVIRSTLPADAVGANAVISLGGSTQAVRESLAQVRTIINAHGGKL